MKKTNNSTFRQIRVAAMSALAAFACVGGARAADDTHATLYYQVTAGLCGNTLSEDEMKNNYYTLYSVSRTAMANMPGMTDADRTDEVSLSAWLGDKDHYWARKEILLAGSDKGKAVEWSVSGKLEPSAVSGGTSDKIHLRGTHVFTERGVKADDKQAAIWEDSAWMILYYHKGDVNSVRVMYVDKAFKYDSSSFPQSSWKRPVLKGGITNITFANANLVKDCGDVFDILLPDNGVTLSEVSGTNYLGKTVTYSRVPPANLYGVDKGTEIEIVYKAPEGYEFKGVGKDTYTYQYTVDGNDVPASVVPEVQKLSSAKTKDDNGDDVTVIVSPTWLAKNDMTADDLTKTGANDIVVWQSYVLGLNPNEKTSQTVLAPVQTSDPTTLTLTLGNNFAPKTDAGVTVKYQLGTKDAAGGAFEYDEEHEQPSCTFSVPLPESGVEYYSIRAKFYGTPQQ